MVANLFLTSFWTNTRVQLCNFTTAVFHSEIVGAKGRWIWRLWSPPSRQPCLRQLPTNPGCKHLHFCSEVGGFWWSKYCSFFGFTPRCRSLSHGVVKTPFSTGVTRCLFSVSMTHWYTSGSSYCRLIPPPFLHISLCTTLIVSFNVGTSWLDCSDPRQDHLSQYVGTAIDAITRQITQQILKIFLNLVNLIWCHIHAAQFVPLYYWMCWAVSSSSSWIFSDSSWSRFKHLYRCQSQGLLQKGPL